MGENVCSLMSWERKGSLNLWAVITPRCSTVGPWYRWEWKEFQWLFPGKSLLTAYTGSCRDIWTLRGVSSVTYITCCTRYFLYTKGPWITFSACSGKKKKSEKMLVRIYITSFETYSQTIKDAFNSEQMPFQAPRLTGQLAYCCLN